MHNFYLFIFLYIYTRLYIQQDYTNLVFFFVRYYSFDYQDKEAEEREREACCGWGVLGLAPSSFHLSLSSFIHYGIHRRLLLPLFLRVRFSSLSPVALHFRFFFPFSFCDDCVVEREGESKVKLPFKIYTP